MQNSIFGWGHKLHDPEGINILERNILSDEYLHSS